MAKTKEQAISEVAELLVQFTSGAVEQDVAA